MRPPYITAIRFGVFRDQAEVVGDQDHGRAGADARLGEHVHHLRLDGGVERGGRLVRDQQLGIVGDRHGDHGALPHSAGKLVRELSRPARCIRDADQLQQLDDPAADLRR